MSGSSFEIFERLYLICPCSDKLIPYVALETEERCKEYYADGLHLTVKGYDRLATLAFEVLKTELNTSQQAK